MPEPLMTLPDSALRRLQEQQQSAQQRDPCSRLPAWMQKATPEEIDAVLALFPRCAVCGRPVEKLAWTADPVDRDVMVFTAWCHGAEEACEIPRAQALQGIAGDVAFQLQAALPPART
jgi:hypothetical protein